MLVTSVFYQIVISLLMIGLQSLKGQREGQSHYNGNQTADNSDVCLPLCTHCIRHDPLVNANVAQGQARDTLVTPLCSIHITQTLLAIYLTNIFSDMTPWPLLVELRVKQGTVQSPL